MHPYHEQRRTKAQRQATEAQQQTLVAQRKALQATLRALMDQAEREGDLEGERAVERAAWVMAEGFDGPPKDCRPNVPYCGMRHLDRVATILEGLRTTHGVW